MKLRLKKKLKSSKKGTPIPTSVWSKKKRKGHVWYGTSCIQRVIPLRSSWWQLRLCISVGSAVPPLILSRTAHDHNPTAPTKIKINPCK